MNDKINANEFRESLDRHLSDMKADPWLAQRIIASERGEGKVKKKLSVSVILVVSLLLVLTTAALAVTGLYQVINKHPVRMLCNLELRIGVLILFIHLSAKFQMKKLPLPGTITMMAA